jgi:hypothetical protein
MHKVAVHIYSHFRETRAWINIRFNSSRNKNIKNFNNKKKNAYTCTFLYNIEFKVKICAYICGFIKKPCDFQQCEKYNKNSYFHTFEFQGLIII